MSLLKVRVSLCSPYQSRLALNSQRTSSSTSLVLGLNIGHIQPIKNVLKHLNTQAHIYDSVEHINQITSQAMACVVRKLHIKVLNWLPSFGDNSFRWSAPKPEQQEKLLGKDPGTERKGSGITSDLRAEWTPSVIQNSWGVRQAEQAMPSSQLFFLEFSAAHCEVELCWCGGWRGPIVQTCLGPGLLTSETSGRKQIYFGSFSADNPLSQFLFSFISFLCLMCIHWGFNSQPCSCIMCPHHLLHIPYKATPPHTHSPLSYTGDGTQGLTYARQALYHPSTSLILSQDGFLPC